MTEAAENQLRSVGIRWFAQLATLDERAIKELKTLDPDLAAFDWTRWRRRFGLEDASKIIAELKLARGVPIERLEEDVIGTADLGSLYRQPPAARDALAALAAIGAAGETELNRLGIYRFWQLAELSDRQWCVLLQRVAGGNGNQDAFRTLPDAIRSRRLSRLTANVVESVSGSIEADLGLGSRRRWRSWNAPDLSVLGGDAASDFGPTLTTPPADTDVHNLTRLPGIDRTREALLNKLGLYHYHAFANLTPTRYEALQSAVAVAGSDSPGPWPELAVLRARAGALLGMPEKEKNRVDGVGGFRRWAVASPRWSRSSRLRRWLRGMKRGAWGSFKRS